MTDKIIKLEMDCKEKINVVTERFTPEQQAVEIERFTVLPQGVATNEITKILPKKTQLSMFNYNNITNTAGITINSVQMFIEHYKDDDCEITTNTWVFLNYLLHYNVAKGNQTPKVISFHVREYMDTRGLKDYRSARNQIEREMKNLNKITLSFTDKGKGKDVEAKNFMKIGIGGNEYAINRGQVYFRLTDTFHDIVTKRFYLMPFPLRIFKLNMKYDAGQYYLLTRIAEHKNMNRNKPNENRISVQTLIDACPIYPRYEEIKEQGRISQRIIEPFEKDMDNIEEIKWHYVKAKGERLTDKEKDEATSNYHQWADLIVEIEWASYPEIELSKHQKKKLKDKKQLSSGG